MKLEQQLTSKDLSTQLKEAGYEQSGLWWWVEDYCYNCEDKYPCATEGHTNWSLHTIPKDGFYQIKDKIVAPTIAELGLQLHHGCSSQRTYEENEEVWICNKWNEGKPLFIKADTEANCRAKMWLYLQKEKLI